MIEQQGVTLRFVAFYAEGGVGKTGLTVTFSAYGPAGSLIVTDQAATEIGRGLYRYDVAGEDVDADGEYIGIFHTDSAAVDQQDIPALWVVGRAGVENLDAAVSTRLADEDYVPLSNDDVVAIRAVTDLLPDAGALTSLAQEATVEAVGLAVDALGAPLQVDDARLDNLDATVSSRLADEDFVPLSNDDVIAIRAVTDQLPDAGALTSLAQASDLATVESKVDDIKTKTDSLMFTVAGQVDANVQAVNDTELTGTGTLGDEWGPVAP